LIKKEAIIWCETIFGFYSLKNIVKLLQLDNVSVVVYTRKDLTKVAQEYFGIDNEKIHSIESIDNKVLNLLHRIFLKFIVPHDFSTMYKNIHEKGTRGKIMESVSKFTSSFVSKNTINKMYTIFFGLFYRGFDNKVIVSISRVSKPYLVCSKKIKHISIMESWDHPIKSPYFFIPSVALTWNSALKDDLKLYQSFNNIDTIGPLKFKYIYERNNKSISRVHTSILNTIYSNEINKVKDKGYILYACTTSSINPESHKGELDLIDCIVRKIENKNLVLYIKPKPNGNRNDYDIFLSRHNVIIGIYANNNNSIDMLDEQYHSFRYLLLYYSKIVINVGTTFSLEAALTNKKILQLKINSKDFGRFGAAASNEHIEKYLNNEHSFEFNKTTSNLLSAIDNYNELEEYSKKLKEWIVDGNQSLEEKKVLDYI
jgi:hypothetical protein